MEKRKADHIGIAFKSQVSISEHDSRFHYEPLMKSHPGNNLLPLKFLGKQLRVPLWVSSMTGGTTEARKINTNLANACHEFGMGMGLGSCRALLNNDDHLADFDMRRIIGDDLPLYANLGICQVEQMIHSNQVSKIHDLVAKLRADGLIIHVNPLQEWFQPEGDRLEYAPIDTIKRFLYSAKYPVIVKEVGQGMGPASLRELFRLPLAAVEFAAFGGTNFSMAELLRSDSEKPGSYEPLTRVGENALDMIGYVNTILRTEKNPVCRDVIVSGGIKNFLEGFYLIRKIETPAVYGQASGFLLHAKENYEELHDYVEGQIKGLKMAYTYLTVK